MSWLKSYGAISPVIKRLVLAEFFLQLMNTSYFMILNFFLVRHGYEDQLIAQMISYRFLAVMALSLPFGFFIPSRRLLPIFRTAACFIPISSVLILWAAPAQRHELLALGISLFGIATAAVQVIMVPFIMRNESEERRTEAIALHFTTWSVTSFLLGVVSFGSNAFLQEKFPESSVLMFFTALSLIGVVVAFLPMNEKRPDPDQAINFRSYDWAVIARVLAPSVVIGIGAGLTIPFINLFFLHVFYMEYDEFSMMGAISTLFVTIGNMYGPRLKKAYGYRVAITMTQSLAVLALVVLALTEQFKTLAIAFPLAVLCYLLRQPLMNMANPIVASFAMEYVGEKNREITSALQQAFWAGSWFFSTQIFRVLRAGGYSYTTIFLTTAAIYGIGVLWYHILIQKSDVRVDHATPLAS